MPFPLEECLFFGLFSSVGEVTCVSGMPLGTGGPNGLSLLIFVVFVFGDGDASLVSCQEEKPHIVSHLLWTKTVV